MSPTSSKDSLSVQSVAASQSPSSDGSGSLPPLRVAIVGAGKMGRHHARAISRLSGIAKLAAVVDPSVAARDSLCALYPPAQPFESLQALLAAPNARPDVIHVCTAPETHEAIAAAAVEAGCHVYVEKPFVTTAAAAERLLALAKSKNVSVCVGHQLLFESATRELLGWLPSLGEIVHVESYFSFRTVRRAPNGQTPLRADQQLIDILPHSVSLLLRMLAVASPDGEAELVNTQIGPSGTVHSLIRRGGVTGTLVVTLEGRPIESFVRVVGTNGTVHADFVRGTVQRLIGPGTSGIDKVLAPFQLAWQLGTGTSRALAARVLKRQRSYPGLAEICQSFYTAIQSHQPSPTAAAEILDTVRICESIGGRLTRPADVTRLTAPRSRQPFVLVTGGTGFLGRAVVRSLIARGAPVRVVARRLPAEWERIAGVSYVACDLANGVDRDHFEDVSIVVHCAAETAGGKSEHERNSVGATEKVLRSAANAGVRRVIHISSLAVLASGRGRAALNESSPLEPERERCGPYVWGKLESELVASRLGAELGLQVKIVRPGAILDYDAFDPPGRLGKRVGKVFVAVGSKRSRLGVVGLDFAAGAISWMALHFADAPALLNLLSPELPDRAELVTRLRRRNPDIVVVWLPRAVLLPLSWLAVAVQKIRRPRRPAIEIARVFSSQKYDTSRVRELAAALESATHELPAAGFVDAIDGAVAVGSAV